MQVALPRVVGLAALLIAGRLHPDAVVVYHSFWTWLGFGSIWVVVALMLVFRRAVPLAGALLAALSVAWMVWPQPVQPSGLVILAWFGLILAVTEGRPHERALMVRVLVISVYVFAVLSKLQPSYLAGEQLVTIARTRDHMAGFLPLFTSTAGPVLAWLAVAAEGWLAVGLWFARTRRATVVIGVGMHLALWIVAVSWWWAGINLAVLNGLLVAGYLAFFHPVRDVAEEAIAPDPDTAGSPGPPRTPLSSGGGRQLVDPDPSGDLGG